MREPDLVQRAERASIVLEQAWERWRAMHGLGAEPLPPVSSYVGYSLEEPWGQPRVVFGLRADEAELLAAQLDGHECAGPLYAEVSVRADWRRSVNGPASLPRSPYGDPYRVPAQARPPEADLIPPESVTDYADELRIERVHRESAVAESATTRRRATTSAGAEGQVPPTPAEESEVADEADWPGPASDSGGQSEVRGTQASMANSPPLAPLPPVVDFRPRPEPPSELVEPKTTSASSPNAGRATGHAQGPGYRGPRYRGFPPRYQAGSEPETTGAEVGEADAANAAEPADRRPQHVAKVTRPPRKRTKSVRPADPADPPAEQSAADQAR